jgi:hypothetical protein
MSFKTPRASSTNFGSILLTSDLGGTAAEPTVVALQVTVTF